MTAPRRIASYALEDQTPREDVANAVSMFEDVKRTAMNCDFQSLERGLQLLRQALEKLSR